MPGSALGPDWLQRLEARGAGTRRVTVKYKTELRRLVDPPSDADPAGAERVMRYALCPMRYALCVMRYALCATRYALFAMCFELCVVRYVTQQCMSLHIGCIRNIRTLVIAGFSPSLPVMKVLESENLTNRTRERVWTSGKIGWVFRLSYFAVP